MEHALEMRRGSCWQGNESQDGTDNFTKGLC